MTNWADVSKAIGNIVPTIANAILPGSGTALSMLSNALTGKPNATPEEVLQASQNADAIVKMRQVELEWQLHEDQLKQEVSKLEITAPYEDTANARQREEQLATTGKEDSTPRILAFMFIGFYLIFAMANFIWPSHASDGFRSDLTNIAILIIGYYFGSSSSSRKKDLIIADNKQSK